MRRHTRRPKVDSVTRLRQLTVRGFKSIRELEGLKLANLNVLIGANGAGKSNFISLFRMLAETSKDPLLKQVCRLILQDESRHMGFGMLSLPDVIGELTDAERAELEEVTHWALVKTLTGQFPGPVYQELGFTDPEIKEIHGYRRERAAGAEGSHFRKLFRKDLHGTLLANLQKVGLLTDRMRPRLESVGIRVPAGLEAAG